MNQLLLLITLEELAEASQAISKILRFGIDSSFKNSTNRHQLEREFGDVLGCMQLLSDKNIINLNEISYLADKKVKKILDTHREIL
jgi:NTP pyrophosphatase (non-canonical NTP hydrolase)